MMKLDCIDLQHAFWAWHPERKGHEDGVTRFYCKVCCSKKEKFHLAVSADNRFNFYLDGKLLGRGPCRGCLEHYYYDEYMGVLSVGVHIFSAEVLVWRDAWRSSPAPWSECHAGGGFFVAGFAGTERMELPGTWLTSKDIGYRSLLWQESWCNKTLIPAPPFEEINLKYHDYDWTTSVSPSGNWVMPVKLGRPVFHHSYQLDPETPWYLEPRPIPQMEQSPSHFTAILTPRQGFELHDGMLKATCPKGKYTVLLDAGINQTVILKMTGTGGTGQCRIAYSEALYNEKRERTFQIPGNVGQQGCSDHLHFPGGDQTWEFRPFWYRTGRFYELEFDLEEPIRNFCLEIEFITYAFKEWLPFSAPEDPVLEKIYQVGCHTLKCCSHEHFEDCPYYEQFQYIGDSRVEALASYAATGDDSLGQHSLRMFGYSQLSNGMTQSRFPSVFKQIIPAFSLIWGLMLYDHYCIFRELALVRELLPKILHMLNAFEEGLQATGLIQTPEGWHFVDWAKGWYGGCPDRGEVIPDTLHNLFYAETCRRMAELQEELKENGSILRKRWKRTVCAVNQYCYDKNRKRYQDVPDRKWYSLHANILAILAGAIPHEQCSSFLADILADKTLIQPSLYFEFYVLSAMQLYAAPEAIRKRFRLWEKMLEQGHTTFPETPDFSCRSFCHAWSAAPVWFIRNSKPLLLHWEDEV